MYNRFVESMTVTHEMWHDGIGYDLEALAELEPWERTLAESLLIARRIQDWRDVEALAALASPRARSALRANLTSPDFEIRLASAQKLFELGEIQDLGPFLVEALAESLHGSSHFSRTLDLIGEHKSLAAIPALLEIARAGDAGQAVHCAAMLFYLRGKADSTFDWDQRPFFLRLNTTNHAERAEAFNELCRTIGLSVE